MTLNISLTAETEARLRERAAAEGKDPAAFALEALEEKLDQPNGSTHAALVKERMAAWRQFVAGMETASRNLPPGHRLDDSRESIYEGRGE